MRRENPSSRVDFVGLIFEFDNQAKTKAPKVNTPNALPAHQPSEIEKKEFHSTMPFKHRPRTPINALIVGAMIIAIRKNIPTFFRLSGYLLFSSLDFKK